jgi:hypothetical protein
VVQISRRVESVGIGGLQNGEDNHTGVGPGLGVAEQPVDLSILRLSVRSDQGIACGLLWEDKREQNSAIKREKCGLSE